MLSPFEWWCRNFILPDICKPCLFVFLRNLFYLTLGFAVCFAQDQVFFSISNLPEEEQEEALTKIIIFLAGLVPVDHLKGLEQAAISKRAERLKEYKEYIEDLPEKDAKGILKELAILEKIRAQK